MKPATVELIYRHLGIDVTDARIRARAWQRIPIWRDIANECQNTGNVEMAETVRSIYRRAVTATDDGDSDSLLCLAMLAGPERQRPARRRKKPGVKAALQHG